MLVVMLAPSTAPPTTDDIAPFVLSFGQTAEEAEAPKVLGAADAEVNESMR